MKSILTFQYWPQNYREFAVVAQHGFPRSLRASSFDLADKQKSREEFKLTHYRICDSCESVLGRVAIILHAMGKRRTKAFIEVGFIVFLFYTNLLMGEFERSGMGRQKGLLWALSDVLTASNFVIAIAAAAIGYFLIEFLRTRI
jgi:hypothetical protein